MDIHNAIEHMVPQEGDSVIVALSSLLPQSDNGDYSVAIEVHFLDRFHYFISYGYCFYGRFLGEEDKISKKKFVLFA